MLGFDAIRVGLLLKIVPLECCVMALYLSDFINFFFFFFFLFFFFFFFDPACMLYRKVTKLWVARNLCGNLPKFQEKRQSLRVFCPILAN